MRKALLCLALGVVIFGFLCTPAWAISSSSYGFYSITNNNAVNAATGQAQLFVDVVDYAPGIVEFNFRNEGPTASSICDVYFDDGVLLDLATVTNGAGVDFSQDASPHNLPGGANLDPPFVTKTITVNGVEKPKVKYFNADSNPPTQSNGVNPGEWLKVYFSLQDNKNYENVLNSLTLAGQPGGLRIGIHVQGFGNGGSESFINNPYPEKTTPPPVPEPVTMLGILMGLGSTAAYLRRRWA